MKSRKMLTWVDWLVLGGFLSLVLASQAQVQAADLCLPPVHTFWFVMVRIPATGAGPFGDGTVFPGLTFPNGAQAGAFYVDQTQHKQELIFFGPDGVTPVSAAWQDFNPGLNLQYSYDYQTKICTVSALTSPETQQCVARNAAEVASYGHSDFYVMTSPAPPAPPTESVEVSMVQNSLSKPIFLLRRDGTNTTEMRFYNFLTSPIPSEQFILPANCVQ